MKILCLNLSDFQKLVLLIVFPLYFTSGTAFATVYTVNNTADGTGINQLRGALLSAGSTPGTHTINVGPGTYYIDNGFVVFGTSNCDITINGAGIGNTIIDGRRQRRAFAVNILLDKTNLKVTFNGMTFQNCTSTSSSGGGAVLLIGGPGNAFSFSNCHFYNNGAYHPQVVANGGAILCLNAPLSISNCTFSNNTSERGSGGAIYFGFEMGYEGLTSGQLSITNSRFSFNTANNASQHGGAIYLATMGSGGTFSTSITECVFNSNSANRTGGAIHSSNLLEGSSIVLNYNSFVGNSDLFNSPVALTSAPDQEIDGKNNWWGCNGGPLECGNRVFDHYLFFPFLQLKTSVNVPSICSGNGNSVQITTGFTSNSDNEPIAASNLDAIIGRPVSFSVPGSLGILTGVQSTIQPTGTATATFTSNGTPGLADIYAFSDDASNTTQLAVNPPGTWAGVSSADWQLPGNWCGTAVPTLGTDVLIPAGSPNEPVINNLGGNVNNLTIAEGASLTVNDFGTLRINGNTTNNGYFNTNDPGTFVYFSGTGPQSIPGGQYFNLVVAGADKTLSSDVRVNSNLFFSGTTKIALGYSYFTLADGVTLNGVGAGNYFITNGAGALRRNNIGFEGSLFPVGTETSYTPVFLTNAGTADNFIVRVGEGAYTSYLYNAPQGSPIDSKSVNKTWYIDEEETGGSNVGVTLYWNASDELSSFDRNLCFVSHYKNDSWNPTAAGPASGADPYFKNRSGITSFSPFAVTNPGSPLPVTLARFDATREGNTALLSWSTTYETNSDRFEVERSVNGKSWEMIGSVKSGGESRQLMDYHFVDLHPVYSQENLYRLRMVDRDGTFAYSRIRNLYFEGSDTQIAYPNPATDKLFVQDFNQVSSLQMIDMNGRVIHQSNGMSNSGIHVGKFSAGLHLLEISWKDGRKTTQKVLINR